MYPLENSVDPDQLDLTRICTVFHAPSDPTVFIEIMQLNCLENRNENAIF